MEQNIYLDVYFSFNFLMDFFVLFLTGILIKNNKKLYRTILAAIIGAGYATVVLIIDIIDFRRDYQGDNAIIELIATYFLIVYIMEIVAYGKYRFSIMIRNMIIIYMITFMLSGALNAFFYQNRHKNFNITKVIVVVLAFEIVFVVLFKVKQKGENIISLYNVTIFFENKKINVVGLVDTGNSLVEPVTGKPVSVIEKQALGRIPEKILYVPYNSVGKDRGLMKAFVADSINVGGKICKKPIIGIHEGSFGGNKEYQLILHPKILKGE